MLQRPELECQRLDANGPPERGLAAFVAQRARILEAIAPGRCAALLIKPFSTEIGIRLAQTRALGRVELARVFAPALGTRRGSERGDVLAALVAASSFPAWEALRGHQSLPVRRAERVMVRTLRALLTER